MSVTYIRSSNATPIEVALDLELPSATDRRIFAFASPAEPRVRLVVAFGLTSQLERIVAAIARSSRARRGGKIRLSALSDRTATPGYAVSIGPMASLRELQSKLVRSIEPGLANAVAAVNVVVKRPMEEQVVAYIRNFIVEKVPPSFQPSRAVSTFTFLDLRAIAITVYVLDERASPDYVIARWPTR